MLAPTGDLNSEMTSAEQQNYVVSLYQNFPGLFDYYMERYTLNWGHNMMASHYRTVIADMIEEFGNSRLPRSTYEDLAWLGLKEWDHHPATPAWTDLSQTEKDRVNDALNDHFRNGPKNCL